MKKTIIKNILKILTVLTIILTISKIAVAVEFTPENWVIGGPIRVFEDNEEEEFLREHHGLNVLRDDDPGASIEIYLSPEDRQEIMNMYYLVRDNNQMPINIPIPGNDPYCYYADYWYGYGGHYSYYYSSYYGSYGSELYRYAGGYYERMTGYACCYAYISAFPVDNDETGRRIAYPEPSGYNWKNNPNRKAYGAVEMVWTTIPDSTTGHSTDGYYLPVPGTKYRTVAEAWEFLENNNFESFINISNYPDTQAGRTQALIDVKNAIDEYLDKTTSTLSGNNQTISNLVDYLNNMTWHDPGTGSGEEGDSGEGSNTMGTGGGQLVLSSWPSVFCIRHRAPLPPYRTPFEKVHTTHVNDISPYVAQLFPDDDFQIGKVAGPIPGGSVWDDILDRDESDMTKNTRSNMIYFLCPTQHPDGEPIDLYRIQNWASDVHETNVFAYSLTFSEKFEGGLYSRERAQQSIWAKVGDLGSEADKTDVRERMIGVELNKAGRALDAFEELIGGHDAPDEGNPAVNPEVTIQQNAYNINDTSKIGTVDDDTGTTLRDNGNTYRVGPFNMSEYVWAYSPAIGSFSGADLKYPGMIGGIVDGKVVLDNGTEIRIGRDYGARIVYEDMNGKNIDNDTNKTRYEQADTYMPTYYARLEMTANTHNPDEALMSTGEAALLTKLPDDYEYPYPETVFYLDIDRNACGDANTLETISFEYRRTIAKGSGWVIKSRWIDTEWKVNILGVRCQGTYGDCGQCDSWHCSGTDEDGGCLGTYPCGYCHWVHNEDEYNGVCSAHGHPHCRDINWVGTGEMKEGQPLLAVHDAAVLVYKRACDNTVNVRLNTYISIDKYVIKVEHQNGDEVFPNPTKPDIVIGEDNILGEDRSVQTDADKVLNAVKIEKGDKVTYNIDVYNKEDKDVQVRIKDVFPTKTWEDDTEVTVIDDWTVYNGWMMSDWIFLPANDGVRFEIELVALREEGVLELQSVRVYNDYENGADPTIPEATGLLLTGSKSGTEAPVYIGYVPNGATDFDRLPVLGDTGYNENRAYIVTRNMTLTNGDNPAKESDTDKKSINVNYPRVSSEERPLNGPVVNLAELDEYVEQYETDNPELADKTKQKTVIESSDFYTIKEYDINIDKYIRNVEHDWSNNEFNADDPHDLIMSDERTTSAGNNDYGSQEQYNNVDSTIYPNSEGGGDERQGNIIGGSAAEQEKAKEDNPVWVEYGDIITYCITIYNTVDHDNDEANLLHDGDNTPPYAKHTGTGLHGGNDRNRKGKDGPFFSPNNVYIDITDTLPENILGMEEVTTMLQGGMNLSIESVEAYKEYDFDAKSGDVAEYANKDVQDDEFTFKQLEVPANKTTIIVVTIVVEEVEKATIEENNVIIDRNKDKDKAGWGYSVRNINYTDLKHISDNFISEWKEYINTENYGANKDDLSGYRVKNNTTKDDTSDWYKINDYRLTIDKYVSSYNHIMMDWNNGTRNNTIRNSEGAGQEGVDINNFIAYDVNNPDYREREIVDNKGFSNYDNFILSTANQDNREYIYVSESERDSREGKNRNFDEPASSWRRGNTSGTQSWRFDNALPVEKREKVIYSIRLTNEAQEDRGYNEGSNGGITDIGRADIFPITTRKPATQVRPTKIVEQLQDGLTLIAVGSEQAGTGTSMACNTHMVDAVIYNKDGSVDVNKTQSIKTNNKIIVTEKDNNTFEFELGNEVILDPGQYLVYYVMVEIESTNMWQLPLENVATITEMTNINHGEELREDRKVKESDMSSLFSGSNSDINQNIVPKEEETSKDYVKMKELIIAGKVWLDENRDGHKDESEYVFENLNVVLLNGSGTEITRVKTDDSGFYTFGRVYRGSEKPKTQTQIGGTAIQSQYDANYTTNNFSEYVVQFEYDGVLYKPTEIYGGNTDSTGRYDLADISTNNYGMDNLDKEKEEWLQLIERAHYNEDTKDRWEKTHIYNTEFREYAYDSNAYEYHDIRREFNENYETISYNQGQAYDLSNPTHLDYSKNKHVSKLVETERDTLDGGNRKMTAESFIRKGTDHPGTFSGSDAIRTLWLPEYQIEDIQYSETEYLKYINLGLVEREEFDLQLTQDLFEIKTVINGEEITYMYDKLKERYEADEQGVYELRKNHEDSMTDLSYGRELNIATDIYDRLALNPDVESEFDITNLYRLKLYESDYKYRKDLYENPIVGQYKDINSELNIEVTYKIAIDSLAILNDEPEQATDRDVKIEAKINEIVSHYDANFMKFGEEAGTGFIKSSEENEILLKLFDELGYLRQDLEKSKIQIAEAWIGDRTGRPFYEGGADAELANSQRNPLKVYTETEYTNELANHSNYHTAYIRAENRDEGIVSIDEGGRTYLGIPLKDKTARENLAQDPSKVGEYIDENDNHLGMETDDIFNTDGRVDRDVAYIYIKYIIDKADDYTLGYIGEQPEGRLLKLEPTDGDEYNNEPEKGITTIAEIGAFSTYYQENERGEVEAAGLVDRDSNPGNIPEYIDDYEENAEDDTCRTAVNMTVSVEEPADPDGKKPGEDPEDPGDPGDPGEGSIGEYLIRTLTGRVWNDSRSESTGDLGEEQYVGNGINTVDGKSDVREFPDAKANINVNFLNGEKLDLNTGSADANEQKYLENNDTPVPNLRAEIIEIVEIPKDILQALGVTANEESRFYEQILKQDEVAWRSNRKQFTRTDAGGNYALSGFIPGYYIVRFTYGDAYEYIEYEDIAESRGTNIFTTSDSKMITEEMSVFNGQDYKSTKYTTGMAEGTTARLGDGTEADINAEFPYGIDEEHGISGINRITGLDSGYDARLAHYDKVIQAIQNENENDARDDESQRLKAISYSETMTNRLAEILKAPYTMYAKAGMAGAKEEDYYNSIDLNDIGNYTIDSENERYSDEKIEDYLERLLKNTQMNSDTIIFHVRPEKGDSIRDDIYEDYTGDKDTKGIFDRLFNKQYRTSSESAPASGQVNITYDNLQHMILEDIEQRNYRIENIDFGIEYRPETQISLHKEIKSIEVIPAGNTVPLVKIVMRNTISSVGGIEHTIDIEKSFGLENVQFLPNLYEKNIKGYESEDFIIWSENEQGFVYINIDEEILQGCEIRIDYGFTVANEGEIDRINRNLDDIRFADNTATPDEKYYAIDGVVYSSVYNPIDNVKGAIYTPSGTAREEFDKEFYMRTGGPNDRNGTIDYRRKLKLYDITDTSKRILDGSEPIEYYGRYMGNTYYTGDVEEPDTIVRLKFDKVLDYLDTQLVFEEVKQFGIEKQDTDNRGWKTSTSGELAYYDLLKNSVFNMTLLAEPLGGRPVTVPGIGEFAGMPGTPTATGSVGYITNKKGELYDTNQRSNLVVTNDDARRDYNGVPQEYGETVLTGDNKDVQNKSMSRFLLPKVTTLGIAGYPDEADTHEKTNIPDALTGVIDGTTYSGRISLVGTKYFATEADTRDMQFENVAEIIQFTITNGRRTNFRTTVGNAEVGSPPGEFPPSMEESDTSTVEQITLTPPTGFNMNRIKRVVNKAVEDIKQVVEDNPVVVTVIMIVAVAGIGVVITKYVIERRKKNPIK